MGVIFQLEKSKDALFSGLSTNSFCTRVQSKEFIDSIIQLEKSKLFINDKPKLYSCLNRSSFCQKKNY